MPASLVQRTVETEHGSPENGQDGGTGGGGRVEHGEAYPISLSYYAFHHDVLYVRMSGVDLGLSEA